MTDVGKVGLEGLGARRPEFQEVGGSGSPLQEMPGLGEPTFAETLQGMLDEVSDLHVEAQDTIGAFLRGEPVETHRVMAAAEEAGIALEMLIEIRNKFSEAYRSVMQMQS